MGGLRAATKTAHTAIIPSIYIQSSRRSANASLTALRNQDHLAIKCLYSDTTDSQINETNFDLVATGQHI